MLIKLLALAALSILPALGQVTIVNTGDNKPPYIQVNVKAGAVTCQFDNNQYRYYYGSGYLQPGSLMVISCNGAQPNGIAAGAVTTFVVPVTPPAGTPAFNYPVVGGGQQGSDGIQFYLYPAYNGGKATLYLNIAHGGSWTYPTPITF